MGTLRVYCSWSVFMPMSILAFKMLTNIHPFILPFWHSQRLLFAIWWVWHNGVNHVPVIIISHVSIIFFGWRGGGALNNKFSCKNINIVHSSYIIQISLVVFRFLEQSKKEWVGFKSLARTYFISAGKIVLRRRWIVSVSVNFFFLAICLLMVLCWQNWQSLYHLRNND